MSATTKKFEFIHTNLFKYLLLKKPPHRINRITCSILTKVKNVRIFVFALAG